MRWSAVLLAGCLAPLVGCSLYQNAAHNVWNEPRTYQDTQRLKRDIHKEAYAAWEDFCRIHPDRAVCEDMGIGYRDGFADYLENGGMAQPPAFPPKRYQRSRYLTPEGQLLVQDYFAGYDLGLKASVASNKRAALTVQIMLPQPVIDQPLNVRQTPLMPTSEPPPTMAPMPMPMTTEPLPLPKKVEPGSAVPMPNRPLAQAPQSGTPPGVYAAPPAGRVQAAAPVMTLPPGTIVSTPLNVETPDPPRRQAPPSAEPPPVEIPLATMPDQKQVRTEPRQLPMTDVVPAAQTEPADAQPLRTGGSRFQVVRPVAEPPPPVRPVRDPQ